MPKQKKLPKAVLEELEENPNISESIVEAARHATIRDEGWNRISGDGHEKDEREIELPEVIETGLTIGDLVVSKDG